jgi:uncharacterized membrane protein
LNAKKLATLVRGRVVSDVETNSDRLALRFSDGSTLIIEAKQHGFSVVLHELARNSDGAKNRPTARQREYLEFIRKYMARHGYSPAESDISDYFMVSAPTAHLMVKTLERRGFIGRDRDLWGHIVPRSIRVLID